MIEKGNFVAYIEGVKVPFNAITMSFSSNVHTMATISMPSSMSAPDIPRFSMVQIFYYDPYVVENTEVKYKPGKKNWYLLWEGVVVGYSFAKTPSGSTFSLTCADYMIYMSIVKSVLFNHRMGDPSYSKHYLAAGDSTFKIKPESYVSWVDQFFTGNQVGEDGFEFNTPDGVVVRNMKDMCENFLKRWTKTMPLMTFHMNRLRFPEKFSSVEDDKIKKIFSIKSMKKYIEKVSNQIPGELPVISILNEMLGLSMYNYVNIGPCPYLDTSKKLGQFVLKPDLYFRPAPKCNVFFPDQVEHATTSNSYLNTPTRTRMLQPVDDKSRGWNTNYFAPKVISDMIKKKAGISDDGETAFSYAIGTDSVGVPNTDGFVFLDEEIDGTVILKSLSMRSEVFGIDTPSDKPKNERINDYVNYKHEIAINGDDTIDIVMKFSPQVVVGFPCVYLDNKGSFTGYVTSLSHSISADGRASTNVTMNFAKPLKSTTDDIEMPPFIATAFDNNNIDSTYERLLGCRSIHDGNVSNNIPQSVSSLFDLDGESLGEYYKHIGVDEGDKGVKDGDIHRFINEYTHRKVATLDNVRDHYRLSKDDEDGNPIVPLWRFVGDGYGPRINPAISPFDYLPLIEKYTVVTDQVTYADNPTSNHKQEKVKAVVKKYGGIVDGR